MACRRLILVAFVSAALSPLLHAQVKPPETQTKPPQIKLEVIPTKETYSVGEDVVVKYKLTNPSDMTVCFPRPDTRGEDELKGDVRTRAINSESEKEMFIQGFYRRDARTDQELLEDANENWIKLAPGLSYVTEEARPLGDLAAGDWRLQSRYSPPHLRGRAKLIVDALSCTPPEIGATSKLVKVKITADSENP
jgi:hypothetical protein